MTSQILEANTVVSYTESFRTFNFSIFGRTIKLEISDTRSGSPIATIGNLFLSAHPSGTSQEYLTRMPLKDSNLITNLSNGPTRVEVTKGANLKHPSIIHCLAFSPDGKLLATGSGDKTVCLWNVGTRECQTVLKGHRFCVHSLAFSPDGKLLATGSGDKTIRLWNVETRECQTALKGHRFCVHSLAFLPDGKLLATGNWDKSVCLWNVRTRECLAVFNGLTGWMHPLAFSPSRKFLATVSHDKTVYLWNVETGNCLFTLVGHTDSVRSLAFSPDEKLLATGSDDKTVCLWDVETGNCLSTLEGHTDSVHSLVFSLDGKLLASGSDDKTVLLWDIDIESSDDLISLLKLELESSSNVGAAELRSMVDLLGNPAKTLVTSEELKEITEELLAIKKICAQYRRQLEQLAPNSKEYSELKKKIDRLEAQHMQLWEVYQAKEQIREQQQLLQEHRNLWNFYRTVQIRIEEIFIGYKAIASNLIDPKVGRVSSSIQLLGTLISLIPIAGGGVVSVVGAGYQAIDSKKRSELAKSISLLINLKGFQKLAENVARTLALKHQEDILNLKTLDEEFFAEKTAEAASRIAKVKIKAKRLFTRGKKKAFKSQQLVPAERLAEFAVLCMIEKLKGDELDRTKPLDRVLLEGVSSDFSELAAKLRSKSQKAPANTQRASDIKDQMDRTEKTMQVEIRRRQRLETRIDEMEKRQTRLSTAVSRVHKS